MVDLERRPDRGRRGPRRRTRHWAAQVAKAPGRRVPRKCGRGGRKFRGARGARPAGVHRGRPVPTRPRLVLAPRAADRRPRRWAHSPVSRCPRPIDPAGLGHAQQPPRPPCAACSTPWRTARWTCPRVPTRRKARAPVGAVCPGHRAVDHSRCSLCAALGDPGCLSRHGSGGAGRAAAALGLPERPAEAESRTPGRWGRRGRSYAVQYLWATGSHPINRIPETEFATHKEAS